LLRDHVLRETDLGRQVRRSLDSGELVPDHIVLDMVREALQAAKQDSGGYVLDGQPRTMEQARAVYHRWPSSLTCPLTLLCIQSNAGRWRRADSQWQPDT